MRNCLTSIPRRALRDAYDRITNDGDNVRAAIRRIIMGIQNMPRDAFLRWKDYMMECRNGKLLNMIKANRLKDAMKNIPNRTLKDGFDRVTGDSNKIAGALRRIMLLYLRKPKESFDRWRNYLLGVNRKEILD